MLFAQLSGARSLREIETGLKSHAGKLYHLGGGTISRSALSTANAARPFEVFAACCSALMAQLQRGYRRKIGDCVRLIDFDQRETEQFERQLGDVLGGSLRRQGAHHLRSRCRPAALSDGDAANVNDITAAKEMPIEAGATYVFDLGYYDYGWWAKLDQAGCRIVTRLKANTPFKVVEDRPVAAGIVDPERSHRIPSEAARRFPQEPDVGSGPRNPGHDRDRQRVAHLHQ